MNVNYDDILEFLKEIKLVGESYEGEKVVTYFSPFTGRPVMVETETHKYIIEVTKIIKKEEQQ